MAASLALVGLGLIALARPPRGTALQAWPAAPACAPSLSPCPSFTPDPARAVSPSQPARGRNSRPRALVSALRVTIARARASLPTGRLAFLRSMKARPARRLQGPSLPLVGQGWTGLAEGTRLSSRAASKQRINVCQCGICKRLRFENIAGQIRIWDTCLNQDIKSVEPFAFVERK
jgi:hypothetical protein